MDQVEDKDEVRQGVYHHRPLLNVLGAQPEVIRDPFQPLHEVHPPGWRDRKHPLLTSQSPLPPLPLRTTATTSQPNQHSTQTIPHSLRITFRGYSLQERQLLYLQKPQKAHRVGRGGIAKGQKESQRERRLQVVSCEGRRGNGYVLEQKGIHGVNWGVRSCPNVGQLKEKTR